MVAMGSTRRDIFFALDAFTDHCERTSVDRRPAYWAQYVDMWGDSRGELGVSEPTGFDDIQRTPSATVFALLTPWLAIPTMAEVWLVVDRVTTFWVCQVVATSRGYFNPIWSVAYQMWDNGDLTYREPFPISMPDEIGPAIAAALKGRSEQILWTGDYDLETVAPVVEYLLDREGQQ